MLFLKKSLFLRITLPILASVILYGLVLYFLVLTTVSDFAQDQINHDLASLSRRTTHICDINFNTLLMSGLSNDKNSTVIQQGLTLGQIEDFFEQEEIYGFIYDAQKELIVYQTYIPLSPEYLLSSAYKSNQSVNLQVNEDGYFLYINEFLPWDWQILILKDANVYSTLISKVRSVNLITLGFLVIIGFLMVFFIYKSIHGPTQKIVETIQESKKPDYKGIDAFEFLSDTISGMMDSIRNSEEKYRMLLDTSNHLIWEIDLETNFTFISQTAAQIIGYQPEEIIGKRPFYLMRLDDAKRMEILYQEIMDSNSPFKDLVVVLIHKNGTHVHVETTGVPFYDDTHQLLGYRGIFRDISDRLVAENEKREAQQIAAEHSKQALVGQVAGKMAHDFNNILSIIMGNAELAKIKCKEEKTNNVLELIYNQTIRGKNLTKNLVAFAKDQEPKHTFFLLSDKIKLVLNLMKKDLEGIRVKTVCQDNLPELLADPGMIEHALVNLLQNSIHALSLTQHPVIKLTARQKDNFIHIEIEDNGCGIPSEHINDIFTPSFTLKGGKDKTGSYRKDIKGTGYGMSNVNKYIRQHKGEVLVASQFNKYTKVKISLPIIGRELSENEQELLSQTAMMESKDILVVEDEDAISMIQETVLTQSPCCHRVDIARNASEAFELIDRNMYDLYSLDYILPENINGLDIYNYIRERRKKVPVLFISGNIEFLASIKELKDKDPFLDHLSKPCQNSEYITAVNNLLARSNKLIKLN